MADCAIGKVSSHWGIAVGRASPWTDSLDRQKRTDVMLGNTPGKVKTLAHVWSLETCSNNS
jgi:hypothetical protein